MTGRMLLASHPQDMSGPEELPLPYTWPLLAYVSRPAEAVEIARESGQLPGVLVNIVTTDDALGEPQLAAVRALDGARVPTGAATDATFEGAPISFQAVVNSTPTVVTLTWDERVHAPVEIERIIASWEKLAYGHGLARQDTS